MQRATSSISRIYGDLRSIDSTGIRRAIIFIVLTTSRNSETQWPLLSLPLGRIGNDACFRPGIAALRTTQLVLKERLNNYGAWKGFGFSRSF